MTLKTWAAWLFCGCLALNGFAGDAAWKLATFRADVTPPVGHPLLGNHFAPSAKLVDPLDARGFVLLGPDKPLVLVAIDWCELRNDSFLRWRSGLAAAAGTVPERVMVHAIHQHDAPYTDLTAHRLLAASKPGGAMLDENFHEACVLRTAAALKESLAAARPVTHIGTGQARVDRIASSRRVDVNGKVTYGRYSRCTNPALRELPDGEIDPWLKTLSFWNGPEALCALSVYACHPMSYYGGGEISGDFVNLARKQRDEAEPRIFQLYATGCCGDVTAGKYNDGNKANRAALAERLAAAMAAAWAATQKQPLMEQIVFRNETMVLPHSELPALSEEALRKKLNQDGVALYQRAEAALGLSSLARSAAGHQIDVPLFDLGAAQIVLLPAESFVAYQLFAQRQRPDSVVLTLGFGESAPGYIPTEQAFKEGFREEHGYVWVRPGAQTIIEATVRKLLAK